MSLDHPDVGAGEAVEELAASGIEERAVGVEGAVLDRDRDVVARQRPPGQVVVAAVDQVEAGRPRVDVRPGHPQGVVVIPERRRRLVVGVLGNRRAPLPFHPEALLEDRLELPVLAADTRIAGGDVGRGGQVPGLGVAVALLPALAAVEVGDDRNGAGVGTGGPREPGIAVPAGPPARRICPVKGGVDGQEVGQVVAASVHQPVDPLHAHRGVVLGLDGESRVVERARVVHRPVAPHRCLGHPGREDLLSELANADRVEVDVSLPLPGEPPAARHPGRDDERRHVFVDHRRIEDAGGLGHRRHPIEEPQRQHNRRPGGRAVLKKAPASERCHQLPTRVSFWEDYHTTPAHV